MTEKSIGKWVYFQVDLLIFFLCYDEQAFLIADSNRVSLTSLSRSGNSRFESRNIEYIAQQSSCLLHVLHGFVYSFYLFTFVIVVNPSVASE